MPGIYYVNVASQILFYADLRARAERAGRICAAWFRSATPDLFGVDRLRRRLHACSLAYGHPLGDHRARW